MLPVVCFTGSSGVGKTTLIENIVPELKARGYRVAVIKHAPHGFEIDQKGKDSWRFLQSGADIVVVSSQDKLCLIQQTVKEPSLTQITAGLEGQVDLVIVEGYKRSSWPIIEVVRSSVNPKLIHSPRDLLAIISDQQLPLGLPQFHFKDIPAIASFLIEQTGIAALIPEMDKATAF